MPALDARCRRPIPAVPAARRAVAARSRCRGCRPRSAAAAEVWIKREDLLPLAFGGNKLRNLEFLVGAALAEGADTPRHVGPALVEPRPADRRRRGAGRARRPPRPVRPADRPPNPGVRLDELLGATVHQAVTDDRAEREALLERVVAELRQRSAARRHRRRRFRRRSARSARSWRPSSSSTSVAALGFAAGRPRRADRRPAAPRPACSSGCGRPAPRRPSTASRSRRRRSFGRRSSATRRGARLGRRTRPRPGLRGPPRRRAARRRATAGATEAADEATRLLARTRGHPGRPDLHRQGAGRAHRARPGRPARRPPRRLLARRRHARAVRALSATRTTPRPTATRRGA